MAVTFHPISHRLSVTIDQPIFEAAHAAALAAELSSFSGEPVEAIDLDFAQVEQIDSLAIETLIGLKNRFASHHQPPALAFTNPSPSVRQVISLLGLDRLFEIGEATPLAS